jgi:hypothetical protein
LAKIHTVQVELGREPDALFLGGPDMTVTRNLPRWDSGFAYGGKLDWRGAGEPLIVLQVKPNVCGMLVAGLAELPPPAEVAARLTGLRQDRGRIWDLPLEFDLDRSNHFANLYATAGAAGLPPYLAILHGAAPELRDDNALGAGLYWDRSALLARTARHFETPWGPLDVLLGEAAEEYWRVHQQAAEFAALRRVLFAERLLGPVQVLSNHLHQGLTSPEEMYLGCHPVFGPEELLPFMVRREAPGFLLRGRAQLGPEVLENTNLATRARELGVYQRLTEAHLLPHGSGYAVPGPGHVERRELAGRPRVYLHRGDQETDNPREMIIGYRGEEVLRHTLALGLGELVCTLEFVSTVVAP